MSETPATTKRPIRPEKEKETSSGPAQSKADFAFQQYLEDRDGTPYLPLKWRLAWLRHDHAQATISTRLISHDQGVAIFRANITLPEGGGATGWGAKARSDNADNSLEREASGLDYIMYAENQALSRALAALGYGTEFALDFDPPADHPSFPLPENSSSRDEEPGIIVPITPPEPDSQAEAEIPEPVVRGEIRHLAEKRPAFESRPAPAPRSIDATTTPRPIDRPANRPTEPTPISRAGAANFRQVERGEELTEMSAEPPITASPNIGNSVVDERIKNIRDESLRVLIKQIYYEARQRFNYNEDKLDEHCLTRNGKPTFELDHKEAQEYLERIITATNNRKR